MNDVAVISDLTPEDSLRDISTAAKAKSDTQHHPYKLQHAGTCRKLKLRLCALLCHAKQSDKSPSNSCEVGCEKTFLSSRELRSPYSSTTVLSDKLQSSYADIAGDTIHIPIVAAIHTDLVNEVNHAANSPTDKIEYSNDVLEHVTIERGITLSDKMSAASHSTSHSIINGEVEYEQNNKGNPDSTAIKESDTNHASNGLPVINLSQTSVDESDIKSKVADITETTVTAVGELTGQEPRRVSLTPNMIGPLQLSPGAVLDNDGFTYRLTFPGATSQSVTRQSASPGLTQPVLLVLPDSSHTEDIADNFTTDVTLRESSAKLHHSLSTRRDTLLELPLNYAKSPDGRYIKLDEEVGRGSFKTVYKGLDCETGVNVAWCELMDAGRKTRANRLKFKEEVEMLKGLRHHNILRFYDSWECNKKIVLVTELMTSGTLKLYIKRFRKISTKLIANWCRQILKGLVFLHTRTPPVIHRDLKCDNFFINGQSGRVKIGDLGLAILKPQSFARTVIGTPEFMAPEMYEEHYDERVDVYAFGMCMLEMATSEYPYKECTNPGQIYKRVTKGVRPDSYHRVENQQHKHIIDRCIQYKPEDRMSAGELLQLDFFNEWSVHLDCSWTSQRDVLQFRIRDDVIRTKNHQKEGEAIQFDFNLNDDEPNKMAAELVNNGYLDEGNTKVAVKLMKEKIAFFDTQKRTRVQSMCQDVPKQSRRPSNDESKPLDGEGAGDISRSRTDSTSSQAAADYHSSDGKRRRNSTTKTPTKELEAQKQRKRKALQILIEDISKEDNSTSVTCQLQASKATVTFTFNSDVDTPEDISENLVAYVDHPQQLSVAKEQIQFIFDLVKKHKDQPELAKKICEQKHHIPASNHHTSSSSTGGGDSNRPTPVHSRSSSKDLVSFVDQPVFSDYKQPLVRSNSHDDRPPPSKETAKSGLDSAKLLVSPAKDLAVADFAMPRDRSGTWHTSQLPNRSLSVNEEKLRRESMPGRGEKPFASRPSQLSVIPSGMSAPNTPMTLKKSLGDATGDTNSDHKKASDIAELSKSIERIMYSDKTSNLNTTQSSHTTPTHPTSYVSRSLTSSPRLRKKFVTRLLSTASRTDGGDLISPNDSLGTNSTTLSNYNSLTCDSGFCAILPKTVRTNSICEPLAETTKKVGRFQIGIVKEQVSPARSPSPDALFFPAITTTPVTVPVSIASDTSFDEVTSVLARISERNQQNSPHTVSCPQCVLDSELDDDASLQLIKARQAAERRELEDRQQTEIEVYKTGKKALQTYSENCEKCAQQQVRSGNSKVLCEVHSIAKLLQELAMSAGSNSGNSLLTDSRSVTKERTINNKVSSDDELDGGISLENDSQLGLVSSYLRSGKHFDKEVSKVRRLRHNSVEMVLQRMWSSDAESPPYNDSSSDVTRSAIAEESDDVITDMNSGSALCEFQYPQIDLSRVLERESSSDRIRLIQDEVSQSRRAVIAGLQHQCELNNEALSGASKLAKADHAHSRQQMVKQALQESQAQLLKSLQNALHS